MTDNDPHRYRQRPPNDGSVMRSLMWGGVFLHVVGLLGAIVIYMLGYGGGNVFWGATGLAAVGAVWVIWCRNEDQQDRSAHLFPPPDRAAPKQFSDFKDDTGSNL